ncbi:MAG: alpha/beta fold hydrolase [Rhodospirillales bacterium]|nr:alpha/beta fold hydrolase [Rhodospirillales bacterium]
MTCESVSFYSEGVRLEGDLYRPKGADADELRAGIVLCHGYTGVKSLYLPDNARVLTEAGYVVLTFDYKGWGASEGPRTRLAPFSRVADVQAALTYLGTRPGVDPTHLGLYGTSYGGATAVWAAALDERVRCVVSVVGIGDGRRWMRSVRRPDEWHDLLEHAREDREQAVISGKSAPAERDEVLMQDRASAALSAAQRANNPDAVSTVPASFIDETLSFHADWVVGKIAPRPLLIITTEDDRLVPPEESQSLYDHAGEPKKLIVLKGYGHYDVYTEPAFGEVMAATLSWYRAHLPAQALDAPSTA